VEFVYPQRREGGRAAQRSVAVGTRGMVSSSQYLATMAGARILRKGGNAIDAAVAMVGTLTVVEPHSVGIGGDAFALIYLAKEQRLVGMNGSGRSPYRATIEWFTEHGMREIPERGIYSVTVPGALHGWGEALERYGTLPFADVFEDAISYAEEGFPVTEVIAGEWRHMEAVLRSDGAAAKTYLIDGKAPAPGSRLCNPDRPGWGGGLLWRRDPRRDSPVLVEPRRPAHRERLHRSRDHVGGAPLHRLPHLHRL